MPIVRLRVWDHSVGLTHTSPTRPRVSRTTASLRLMARVLVGADPVTPDDPRRAVYALLDTGSPFNVVERSLWDLWDRRGLVERLRPVGTLPTLAIGGARTVPYHLGRIWLGVSDEATRVRLPAVGVLFQLLDRTAALPHPVILGMHDGVLDGRWLRRVPSPPRRSPHEGYDAGSYYGQEWFLQDEPPKL